MDISDRYAYFAIPAIGKTCELADAPITDHLDSEASVPHSFYPQTSFQPLKLSKFGREPSILIDEVIRAMLINGRHSVMILVSRLCCGVQ
jgi:hypothetical protein